MGHQRLKVEGKCDEELGPFWMESRGCVALSGVDSRQAAGGKMADYPIMGDGWKICERMSVQTSR